MPRFFCPQPLAIGATIALPDAVAHHVHVVRLMPGEAITVFNGEGGEYTAVLCNVEKKRANAELKSHTAREAELPYAVTLAQALPEASKMDWIIEKAIELGAAGIVPLAAQRCVVRLSAERAEKKLAHWQAIIVSASEQCGRNRLAQLAPLQDFNSWSSQQDLHKRIILTPRAEQSLADWARHQPPQAITVMVGPEGGFSEAEEKAALAAGAIGLAMGPRILRTETAGLTALATLGALWGGM
ncbi:ribosomal RNA small subunit methyltransferase E [Janthinobacterium sp. HH103]|uniref:16S rRNA (uracil(1498)-N(3))-methyltransferase n=1 Tax=unclassified Janthinobacterium TaxID=2610881 RepID=UPI000875561E|nr:MULTISPECIES: 16S rRNA (uracil(1498)-N(3))-methyltransferase [unclassified Janthinobacterium]OEZ67005.1 ribosomal RNA small subunit methyltransferase E [Janthinobacterium sp. HH100]OEZ83453.1 ribosomal RNA small subunit methyltransferase E [Janthinobacterium sp. HH103]QOU71944.1 Ribosomal RNA small subunit methyltransferase E [Janthinobacterium sp. HH102]